jgi:hypothetical protein
MYPLPEGKMLDRGWLIICGVLLVIGLFNLGLALSVLRNRGRREAYLRGSLSDMLNPWEQEDEDLKQLHQRVMKLQADERDHTLEDLDG